MIAKILGALCFVGMFLYVCAMYLVWNALISSTQVFEGIGYIILLLLLFALAFPLFFVLMLFGVGLLQD